jgi:hypothetical protein
VERAHLVKIYKVTKNIFFIIKIAFFIVEMVKLKFMEKQELFDRLDKIRVDERIRPEKLRDDEILGFHGNFKKLDID